VGRSLGNGLLQGILDEGIQCLSFIHGMGDKPLVKGGIEPDIESALKVSP